MIFLISNSINEILKLHNVPNMNFFTNYLIEGESISLQRLYKGLSEEAISNKLIQDLKNLIYQNNLNIEKVFQKFDYNDNSLLEPGELFNLLKVLDQNLTMEDSQNIFNKFDINNDGKVSFSEFKRLVSSESNTSDKESLTSTFFENISMYVLYIYRNLYYIYIYIYVFNRLMQENGYSMQQLFGKNTINDKLPLDYFYTGLQTIGYDKERNKEKVMIS